MYAISVFKSSKDYTVEFKTKIMNKMVTGFDEFKLYEPNRGISSSLYREGNFERYDYYTSEDYFSGKIKEKYAIEIGEVHTEAETTDDEGNKHRTTMFHGLFAHIDIPTNFVGSILICSDRGRLGKNIQKK